MNRQQIGKKIKELRLRMGITQDELATGSGLTLRSIQRIESEQTTARGDSLKRISSVLKISVEELTRELSVDSNMSTAYSQDHAMNRDRAIPLLLVLSAFGFLVHPIAGVVFPAFLWLLFKNKIEGVHEIGLRTIKLELVWLGILTFIYGYIIGVKFLNLNLPVPNNSKLFGILLLIMKIANACAIIIMSAKLISKDSKKGEKIIHQ